MISISSTGDLKHIQRFLEKCLNRDYMNILHKYGQLGVQALSLSTPLDSGETATSWNYEIEQDGDTITLAWNNTHVNHGVNIAVILQYGHGTGTGGYVVGRDYINPALRPIFDDIADAVWKEVSSL